MYGNQKRSVGRSGGRRVPAKVRRDVEGTIYLIHFDRPYQHARHYTGWTERPVDERLKEHETGQGSRLLAVVAAAGITWVLAAVWLGTRSMERRLKALGGAQRYCPICGGRRAKRW